MNVTELARQLKLSKDQLFDQIQALGFDVGRRAIKIDDLQAEKIIQAIRSRHPQTPQGPSISERLQSELEKKSTTADRGQIKIPEKISVKMFSERLDLPVAKVIGELIRNGIMANLNEMIDYDTAAIIAEDLGYDVVRQDEAQHEDQHTLQQSLAKVEAILEQEKKSVTQARPPVVVVMGHVDHGKTTLLDSIRATNIAQKESGGITQKIGAYQAKLRDRFITFIDTPGHEAFSAMRSRGANVADIAILVIAADDGIRPQTEEALNLIQSAKLPFLVAINKIDTEGADVERVKKQLSELNLLPEDWGGQTICVPVSGRNKQGIPELLEMILLIADLEKENIQANPSGKTIGTIIEAHIDKGLGPVATVIIQNGTLRIGDYFMVGTAVGKVRALRNDQSQTITEVLPSMPGQILGFKSLPKVGEILEITLDKRILREKTKSQTTFSQISPASGADEQASEAAHYLNLLVKADTLGSLEALLSSVQRMGNEEVRPKIISKGLGNITEREILNAQDEHTLILGFNVLATPGAIQLAKKNLVNIFTARIIYEHLETVKQSLKSMLSPESILRKIGEVKILKIFSRKNDRVIAGGRVTDGSMKKTALIRAIRNGAVIGEGVVEEVQKDKKQVSELKTPSEGGFRLRFKPDLKENDVLEIYEETLTIPEETKTQ